jgi:NAD(P)H-hydrate epimerase
VGHAYNSHMPAHPHYRDLHTVEQVRVMEHEALTALGITGYQLMRRAASAALSSLRRHWPQSRRVCICCGPGNNGGDGFLLGVLAREAGLQVELVALGTTAHGDATLARSEWEAGGGAVRLWGAESRLPVADVLVDALYGIGFNRAPEPSAARLIDGMNASGKPILALDVPTGLDADSGYCPGAAIRADVTVTFIVGKRGLHSGRAADQVGELELANLGVPDSVYASLPPDARLLIADAMPARFRYANKGSYGHVLVIGGEHGMAGAARLAGESALRAGAGLVSVATRAEHVLALNATRPELMVHAVDGPQALAPLLERASVLALGPGLGQGDWAHALWQVALDANKSLVLDADGLNLLARKPCTFAVPTVLTPHPGEAARLLGVSTADVEHDRFAAVRELARCYAATVVLKGSGSLIADPDGRLDVCPWGNPGMASGGMGDLLTGVIAALLAQGCTAWQAACLGVGLHARAGDLAAQHGERGLLASDLLEPLRMLGNGMSNRGQERD